MDCTIHLCYILYLEVMVAKGEGISKCQMESPPPPTHLAKAYLESLETKTIFRPNSLLNRCLKRFEVSKVINWVRCSNIIFIFNLSKITFKYLKKPKHLRNNMDCTTRVFSHNLEFWKYVTERTQFTSCIVEDCSSSSGLSLQSCSRNDSAKLVFHSNFRPHSKTWFSCGGYKTLPQFTACSLMTEILNRSSL